jgi:predicted ATPase/DNA-binding SARP family transcriptional activator
MEFRILGPLEALEEGRDVAPRGEKRRALLALLVVHANQTLPVSKLIDELWGEDPPATAVRTVHVHISRLRKGLWAGGDSGAESLIVTREHGYELTIDPEQLDSYRFEQLIAEGSKLSTDHPERAVVTLEQALSLWRGAPFADLADEAFAQREAARLEDLRLVAIECLNAAKLDLGGHAELVGPLEALIDEHPYRERLRAQLMLALYRCDRQADALQAYQDARRTLVEELGIEPGEHLRALERAVLAQDPTLAVPAVETAKPSRLPAPPNRTLGRDQDRDAVADLLRRTDVRLVTLTGPGGVGKTRLALEIASTLERELPDGAWFVSLAATARVEHVPSTVAQALGATPRRGESSEVAIERYLASRSGLLVLDNLEHLLPAAPVISDLLGACPGMKALATSREALRLQAEHRYQVSTLSVPATRDVAAIEQAPAGALFVERAHSQDRGFSLGSINAGAVADLCRRLDGLPLAIELAAARLPLLGPDELNARLADTLDALGSGARDLPDRQQTLRATIDWSYRLLDPEQAEAFVNFAVFAGGATLEAAEAVTGASLDTLAALVDKHLLLRRAGVGEPSRLLMLETVREYAAERLESGRQATEVHARHVRHYLSLAERAEPHLWSHADAEWLPQLDAEIDNFRAALDWTVQHTPVDALRLVAALGAYWNFRNQFAEGTSRVEAALGAAGHDAPANYRARARLEQAFLVGSTCLNEGKTLQGAREYAQEALELCREVGDQEGAGFALMGLAWFEQGERLPQRRRFELAEEAMACAQETGNERLLALALAERALAVRPEHAGPDLEQAAQGLREIGDVVDLMELYRGAAHNAIKAGTPELAGPWIDLAFSLARQLDDPLEDMLVSGTVGLHALFIGQLDRAEAAFMEQLGHCQELAVRDPMSQGLAGLAAIAVQQGNDERAARLVGAATATGHIDDPDVVAQLDTRFFSAARARHGASAWDQARASGAEMTLEQALAIALGPEPTSD